MTDVPETAPIEKLATSGGAYFILRDLPPETAKRVRELHEKLVLWNSVCLLFPGTWMMAALIAEHMPLGWIQWTVRVFGVFIIGICIQAMAILMHEALHGNLFKRQYTNRWAIFCFGVPAFFSGIAYKVAHLNHHRNTRTGKDQDEIANLCRTPGQYRTLFYTWFFLGTFLYFFIVPWKALSIGSTSERRAICVEYALLIATYLGVITEGIRTGHIDWLVWYWLLPAQVAMFLSNIRGLAEHLCTSSGSPITKTRTTRSNALTSFLMLNLNYHLEHHLFPGVPWYNLRKVHHELQVIYSTTGPFVEHSYTRYALKAFLGGPFQEIRDYQQF